MLWLRVNADDQIDANNLTNCQNDGKVEVDYK